jgi:hypothetical protein
LGPQPKKSRLPGGGAEIWLIFLVISRGYPGWSKNMGQKKNAGAKKWRADRAGKIFLPEKFPRHT